MSSAACQAAELNVKSGDGLPHAEELKGADPYNTGPVPVLDPAEKPKRRSLDDMRELSEVIKAIRPPK
jgi:hypothetical protein